MYSFGKQFKKGKRQEEFLDNHYRKNFIIKPASRSEERDGIDRHFTDRKSGLSYTIQYKADKTAASTGNAFVETVSVDTEGKQGWAYTCRADFIVYYIVGIGPAYIIKPSAIRQRIDRWSAKYQERKIPNRGYNTIGILVPLREFEKIAYAVSDVC